MMKKVNRCTFIDWALTTSSPWIQDIPWKMYLYTISDVSWIVKALLSMKHGRKRPVVYLCTAIAEFTVSFSQFNKTVKNLYFFLRQAEGSLEAWIAVPMFKLPSLSQTKIPVRRLFQVNQLITLVSQPLRSVRLDALSLALPQLPLTFTPSLPHPRSPGLHRSRCAEAPTSVPFPPHHLWAGLIL